ncbi:MAG: gamma-glutamyltransferase [Bdellovibrio sp.]|nr:gamma-glutamyltransferase [Bdellovibrio sp.]
MIKKIILVTCFVLFACAEKRSTEINSVLKDFTGEPEQSGLGRYCPVVGTKGMVVSDDENASKWGVEILRQGGNAIDAAVATAFYLAVSRPHYAALGGGGFLLYCPSKKTFKPDCHIIDYREQAPLVAQRDFYIRDKKARTDLSQDGPLASGTPGVVAGLLAALEKFGTLPRQKILQTPIAIAQSGFPLSGQTEYALYERWEAFNDEAKKIFGCLDQTKKIKPCPVGTVIKQIDLAKTLKEISLKGHKGFYEGWVAKTIALKFQQAGGVISEEDLKQYEVKFRKPISGVFDFSRSSNFSVLKNFDKFEVVTMPPPSAGGAGILQLFYYSLLANKHEAFQFGYGASQTLHALSHAMGLVFADRAFYFGDPDFTQVPLEKLLNDRYLDERWKSFKPDQVNFPKTEGRFSEGQNTTHFSVMDRFGNAVAITTTVNDYFGSGFVPPGTGVVMNNEMDDFSIEPGVPNLYGLVGQEANAIASKKRPLSSMSPTIIRDMQGQPRIVIGAQGGPKITTSVFLALFNRLVFKISLSDAVLVPRFHYQWKPPVLSLEANGFSSEVKTNLTKLGYTIKEIDTSGIIHALERFPNGRVWGISDLRTEGGAVAE